MKILDLLNIMTRYKGTLVIKETDKVYNVHEFYKVEPYSDRIALIGEDNLSAIVRKEFLDMFDMYHSDLGVVVTISSDMFRKSLEIKLTLPLQRVYPNAMIIFKTVADVPLKEYMKLVYAVYEFMGEEVNV